MYFRYHNIPVPKHGLQKIKSMIWFVGLSCRKTFLLREFVPTEGNGSLSIFFHVHFFPLSVVELIPYKGLR